MKIINLNVETFDGACVVGLGNFDGFHMGHQSLFQNVCKLARELDVAPAILIFRSHTKSIVKGKVPPILTTFEDKIAIAEKLGLDLAFIIEFNKEFAANTPEEFIHKVLCKKIHAKGVVVGPNFHFGKNASGNTDTLIEFEKRYGYQTLVNPPVYYNDEMISSTRIRKALDAGDLKTVQACLGRPYRVYGRVIHGAMRGRDLGFPTANIELDAPYHVPREGVYHTYTSYNGKRYNSITSVGTNPTFEQNARDIKIETHLIDFSEAIYDARVRVEFMEYIRPNYKFEEVGMLIEQMKKDKVFAINHA